MYEKNWNTDIVPEIPSMLVLTAFEKIPRNPNIAGQKSNRVFDD
jgi:hypothetical protein